MTQITNTTNSPWIYNYSTFDTQTDFYPEPINAVDFYNYAAIDTNIMKKFSGYDFEFYKQESKIKGLSNLHEL